MDQEIIVELASIENILSQSTNVYDLKLGLFIKRLLAENNGSEIEKFLLSNEFWGGAGSVADQACLFSKHLRKQLEKRLVRLGKHQLKIGKSNIRTKDWIDSFEGWL